MASDDEYQKEKSFISKVIADKYPQSSDRLAIVLSPGTNQKNYFSKAFRVDITSGDDSFRKPLFLKTHGDCEERNRRVNIREKFRREALLYNEALREFEDLQRALKEEDRLSFPECLYADEEWLLMEQLLDYRTYDERRLLDSEHVERMIGDLAKFHALSFALRSKKPDVFRRLCDGLQKPNTGTRERRRFIAGKVWQWTLDALEEDASKAKLASMKDVLLAEYDGVDDTGYVVIIHGDYNQRNVMFKYDKDEKLSDLRMIDFQLSYVTSPVADVLFLLFSSTDGELRLQHGERLVDGYHERLRGFLELLGCDADSCYPAATFRADLAKYSRHEFVTLLVIVRLMCKVFDDGETVQGESADSGADAQQQSTILDYKSSAAEDAFKRRINEVVRDLVRFGYIA